MDTLNVDQHNILLNKQPYPLGSIRLIYPTIDGDNWVSFIFPYWGTAGNVLWRGDITQLINGQTGNPFASLKDFETFCNANIYGRAIFPPVAEVDAKVKPSKTKK